MTKRQFIFGTYHTAATGLWTLTNWSLGDAAYKQNFVEVPGSTDGELDMSAALTDGVPCYGNRTLTATFESSEGSRLEREDRIRIMKNWLDGWEMDIYPPDDNLHYLTGRVSVKREYNDNAHASVTVTAVCKPWKFSTTETRVELTATETEQTAELLNNGRRTVVPLLTITAEAGASVLLTFGGSSWALGAGVYQLPALILPQGSHALKYSGAGEILLTYREAVLE